MKKKILIIAGLILLWIIIATFFVDKKQLEKDKKLTEEQYKKDSISFEKLEVEKENNRDRSTEAFVLSEDSILKRLKSPSTAEFPSITDNDVRIIKKQHHYTILSFVDSQNSYGAMMRSKYICELEFIPEKNIFKLHKLEIF